MRTGEVLHMISRFILQEVVNHPGLSMFLDEPGFMRIDRCGDFTMALILGDKWAKQCLEWLAQRDVGKPGDFYIFASVVLNDYINKFPALLKPGKVQFGFADAYLGHSRAGLGAAGAHS